MPRLFPLRSLRSDAPQGTSSHPASLKPCYHRLGQTCQALVATLLVLTAAHDNLLAEPLADDAPLHARIDHAIAESHVGPTAPIADDATFVRRVYLDLVGRIPSTDEAREFLSPDSSLTRDQLIDRLLASNECDDHLSIVFDVMWMERRRDQYVPTDKWREYLKKSFAENKPFNQLVAEILSASGTEKDVAPASKFLLDRDVEPNAITRDVSRMFFGRDIQCAQCHDHPLVGDYAQSEYYGLLAFLTRSYRFETDSEDKKSKVSYIAEKAEGDVTYASVFEPDSTPQMALPGLVNGANFDQDPVLATEVAYRVAPAANVKPEPLVSRREQLARLATQPDNELFNRNFANRLWRLVMKQGLVEPPDLLHSDNPPAYPVLLDTLGDAFAEMNYDTKAFLAQLVKSQTYQRSIHVPAATTDFLDQARAEYDSLTVESKFEAALLDRIRTELRTASREMRVRRAAVLAARTALQERLAERTKHVTAKQEAAKKLGPIAARLESHQTALAALQKAAGQAQQAAAALPEDKELAAASELLEQRRGSSEKEVAKLIDEAKPLEASVAAAETAIGEINQQLPPLQSAHEQAILAAKSAAGEHAALLARFQAEQSREVDMKHRLDLADRFMKLNDLQQSIARLTAEESQLGDTLATIESRLAAQQQKRNELVAIHEAASSKLQELERHLREANATSTAQQTLHDGLASASEQLIAASAQLPEDEKIASSSQSLSERLTRLGKQIEQTKLQRLQLKAAHDEASDAHQMREQQLAALEQDVAALQTQQQETTARLTQTREARETAISNEDLARKRIRTAMTDRFVVGGVQGLSPEQMARSIIEALELRGRFQEEAVAEWDNKNKDKKPEEIDQAAREAEISESVKKKEVQVRDSFINLFASTPGSPQDTFHATVDQALFLANDGRIQSWINPSRGNLAARVQAIEDDGTAVQEIYLSVFNRLPDEEELRAANEYIHSMSDQRREAIQEIIWSLISSVEFRFNH